MSEEPERVHWLTYKQLYGSCDKRLRDNWVEIDDLLETGDPEHEEDVTQYETTLDRPVFEVEEVVFFGKIGNLMRYVIWLTDGRESFPSIISPIQEEYRKIYPLIHSKKQKLKRGRRIILTDFKIGMYKIPGRMELLHTMVIRSLCLVRMPRK